MRNPLKLPTFRRNPDRPTLKTRAANLKAGLSWLIQRPAQHGEADQGRRAVMAVTVAAAIPLPVLALSHPAALPIAAVSADPHPDRALLDAEAALLRALENEAKAKQASEAAADVVDAVLKRRPVALVPLWREWDLFTSWRCRTLWSQPVRFRHILGTDLPEDHQRWQNAWTGEALRLAISQAVPTLGRGGRTPPARGAGRHPPAQDRPDEPPPVPEPPAGQERDARRHDAVVRPDAGEGEGDQGRGADGAAGGRPVRPARHPTVDAP